MRQVESTSASGHPKNGVERLIARLLGEPHSLPSHDCLLAEIAGAFQASTAGLGSGPTAGPLWRYQAPGKFSAPIEDHWPWKDADALALLRRSCTAREYCTHDRRFHLLVACGQPDTAESWVLWVERERPHTWQPSDATALAMVAACVARAASADTGAPAWARQLDCLRQQQRLGEFARLVRQLAHDFGNVLTGVLGFTELSLGLVAPASPAHRHLTELHRTATGAAAWTGQLHQFATGPIHSGRWAHLAALVQDGRTMPSTAGKRLSFSWDVPADLPPLAIDADSLALVIRTLVQNAAEAIGVEGCIRTTGQVREISPEACLDYLGTLVPGRAVEITVADNGEGISAAVRHHLYRDLFYTTRTRKRGMGLAIVYGLLAAHKGGIRLETHAQGGTFVRIVLPVSPEGDNRG